MPKMINAIYGRRQMTKGIISTDGEDKKIISHVVDFPQRLTDDRQQATPGRPSTTVKEKQKKNGRLVKLCIPASLVALMFGCPLPPDERSKQALLLQTSKLVATSSAKG